MWTFSTLDKVGDLETFHPTNWMQMGYEILFLWMVRMILMSTYTLDQIPFKEVYIHGMLRDEKGEKFSKSKGNNIDPLEMINKYGTDALRFSLLSGITPGNDSRFYQEKVEGGRNLINKLWNISRFIVASLDENVLNKEWDYGNFTMSDVWVLRKMKTLIDEVTLDFDKFQFAQAGEKLRILTWDVLADWYLESSKFEDNKETKAKILSVVIKDLLKLWQPFIPFVTEAIWQDMFEGENLLIESWPKTEGYDDFFAKDICEDFEKIIEVVTAIRNARSENKIEPAKKIKAIIYAGKDRELISSQVVLIKGLRTGIGELEVLETGEEIKNEIRIPLGNEIEIYLIGAVDVEKEKIRIKKELENLEKLIKNQTVKLDNQEFVARAPEAIVKQEQEKLIGWQSEFSKFKQQLENLK